MLFRSTGGTPGNLQYEYVNHFGELLQRYVTKECADIEVKWEFYPGGQLGSEQEQNQACRMGTQNIFSGAAANLTPFCEPLLSLMLPGLFNSKDEANKLFAEHLDEINKISTKYAGVKILGLIATASRTLLNSKKPIYSMADAQNLKWRSAKNPIFIETFKSWGINPIPTPWSEAYSGLKTGVIDGDYNPDWVHWTCDTYEPCKYICDPKCNYHLTAMVIGYKYYQQLPDCVKDIIDKVAIETTNWELDWIEKELIKKSEKGLREAGIIFTDLKDREVWQEKSQSIWPKFSEKIGDEGERLLEIMKKRTIK